MTALDRYLSRVSFWLPRRKRSDVMAELRSVLQERLDTAEAERGRPLNASEAQDEMDRFGHPAIMVSRYVERRPVISAGLAFFFWRVLAIALVGVVAAQLLVFVMEAWEAQSLWLVLDHAVRRTLLALLLGFTCVTASFIIIDRRYGQ
jgi:hypothetical protein